MIEIKDTGSYLLSGAELKTFMLEAARQAAETIIEKDGKKTQQAADEFLLPAEAAKLLKCHTKTVGRWATEGKLTRYLIGGKVLYKRSEVEKALTELK